MVSLELVPWDRLRRYREQLNKEFQSTIGSEGKIIFYSLCMVTISSILRAYDGCLGE